MKYQIGDEILVFHTTGGGTREFPFKASVIGPALRSNIYDYVISRENQQHLYVKDEWICPFGFVIEEVCDTPWE